MSEQFNSQAVYELLKKLHQEKELSPYEANIFDFVSILKEQPDLFTVKDRSSLQSLLTNLPDDVVEVSNQIAEWYGDRPKIEDAIFDRPTFSSQKGAGARKVKPTDKELKELIENAVRESKPPSSPTNDRSQRS